MVFVPADSGFFATLDRRYHIVHILAAALLAAATIAVFLMWFAPRPAWGPDTQILTMKGVVGDKIDLALTGTGNDNITMTEGTDNTGGAPLKIAELTEKSNRSFKVVVTSTNLADTVNNPCGAAATKPCLVVAGGETEDLLEYDLKKGDGAAWGAALAWTEPGVPGGARWSTSLKNKIGKLYNVGIAYNTGAIFRTQGDYVDTLTFVISAN